MYCIEVLGSVFFFRDISISVKFGIDISRNELFSGATCSLERTQNCAAWHLSFYSLSPSLPLFLRWSKSHCFFAKSGLKACINHGL